MGGELLSSPEYRIMKNIAFDWISAEGEAKCYVYCVQSKWLALWALCS